MNYDRSGNYITFGKWQELFADDNYKIIRRDYVGKLLVSTVWTGIDFHNPPLIYETMVWENEKGHFFGRYQNEDSAIKGHGRIIQELLDNKGKIPERLDG
jgi:hypothetical protein